MEKPIILEPRKGYQETIQSLESLDEEVRRTEAPNRIADLEEEKRGLEDYQKVLGNQALEEAEHYERTRQEIKKISKGKFVHPTLEDPKSSRKLVEKNYDPETLLREHQATADETLRLALERSSDTQVGSLSQTAVQDRAEFQDVPKDVMGRFGNAASFDLTSNDLAAMEQEEKSWLRKMWDFFRRS